MDNNYEIIVEEKFKKCFKPNDYFWGLGIENETYIQGKYPRYYNGEFIQNNLKRERYSVNYMENYKQDILQKLLSYFFPKDEIFMIHQMINAHCFDKMDLYQNHKTLYTKKGEQNPKFSGKTILEIWQEFDPWFLRHVSPFDKHNKNIFFDGDTIEFITNNFYKTNIKDIVNELEINRKDFLDHLEIFREKYHLWTDLGPLSYPSYNPGLNQFQTQLDRITVFNNGTFHIHITLPTLLNEEGKIDNEIEFEKQHRILGNIMQWLEPFYISLYGSPDIFSILFEKLSEKDKKDYPENLYFAGGSLRCFMSRYIGVGTYSIDDEHLKKGKYVKVKKEEISKDQKDFWWRHKVEKDSGYCFLEKKEDEIVEMDMGYDLNMMKHYQSGIEIRFLDAFSPKYLKSFLYSFFLLLEDIWNQSFFQNLESIRKSKEWNDLVFEVLKNGYKTCFKTKEEYNFWNDLFNKDNEILNKEYFREDIKICDWFMKVVNNKRKKYKEMSKWNESQFLKYFIKDKSEIEEEFYMGEVNKYHYEEHLKQCFPFYNIKKSVSINNLLVNSENLEIIMKDIKMEMDEMIKSMDYLKSFREEIEKHKNENQIQLENIKKKEEEWKKFLEKQKQERELNMHKKTVEVLYTMFLPHFHDINKNLNNINERMIKMENMNQIFLKNEMNIEKKKKCFFLN